MKKQIKYISFIGVVAIFILQGIWFSTTYNLIEKDILGKIDSSLADANEQEVFERLDISLKGLPKGTVFCSDTTENNASFINNYTYIQESLIKNNNPLKLSKLKNKITQNLDKNHIHQDFIVNRVNPKTGKVLESTAPEINGKLSGAMYSEIIPIKKDYSEGIQILIISPYKAIFIRMIIILISSIMMAIIVGCCIAYQIKIIIKQNKIAQLRLDLTNALIHEMKTPLSSIIMGIKMLKSGKIDDQIEKKNKHFDICIEESNHLLELTNRMLTIAKIEQGKLELNKQLVDLNKLIKSLIDHFKISTNKKVEFISTINNNATHTIADIDYLQEAISNLIDNSIKYSNETVKIELQTTKDDNWFKIKIRDNGLGIDPKDQAKIFEKFERADAIKRKNGATGFGLGLNYVLRVSEAHDGKVEIESIKGSYSEFTICLPLLIQKP